MFDPKNDTFVGEIPKYSLYQRAGRTCVWFVVLQLGVRAVKYGVGCGQDTIVNSTAQLRRYGKYV